MTVTNCPRCGEAPIVTHDLAGYGFTVYCDNCYDGAPDSATRGESSEGRTRDMAIERWNRMVEQ